MRPGAIIAARFRLVEEVARVGNAIAFRAHDEQTGRMALVEILVDLELADAERLARDAGVLAELADTAVARQLAYGANYRASEWPAGPSLRERLAGESLDADEALAIAQQVARWVAELDACGVGISDVSLDDVRFEHGRVRIAPRWSPKPDRRGHALALGALLRACLSRCGRVPAPLLAVVDRIVGASLITPAAVAEELARVATDGAMVTAATVPPRPSNDIANRISPTVSEPPPPSATLLPLSVEHFVVEDEIARGGLGRILRAHDTHLDRTVAIKQLLPERSASRARLVREARITGRLEHPGIVPIYDAGSWSNGEPFYSMKLVAGRSLRETIAETRSLAERLALLPHALAVAEAIAFAHSRGVIHRDIKPSNVIIGEFGETLVVDWGLAKDIGAADQESTSRIEPADQHETIAGAILGTPAYMAPEQAAAKPADTRADVYALGALLYELLSARQPREPVSDAAARPTPAELVEQAASVPPIPLDTRQPGVPVELSAIVRKAMAQQPDARYPTARELAEDLKRFTTGQLVGAHRYTAWGLFRRFVLRHRAIMAVAGAAVIVMVIGGTVSVERIVAARNTAEDLRVRAEGQQQIAERAETEATARADELVLEQANLVVERDPTAALAWLKQYPTTGPNWALARGLVADAWSRGVARHVLPSPRVAWAAAIAPDGTRAAIGERDGTVRLWTLDPIRAQAVAAHGAAITALAFSRDGKLLVSAANDRTVKLWDVASRRAIASLEVSDFVRRAAFAPTERLVVLALQDGTVGTWDLSAKELRVVGRHSSGEATAATFSPDGRLVASSGLDKTVRIWEATGTQVRVFSGPRSFLDVAFAPDGSSVAAIDEHALHLWKLASGAHVALERGYQSTTRLAFVRDGAIAFGDGQGDIHIWWPASGDVQTLRGHRSFIEDVAAAPDAGLLLTTSEDQGARVWPIPATRRVLQLPAPASGVPQFSPDGTWIASGDYAGGVVLWNLASGEIRSLRGHRDWVRSISFSPDGRWLVSMDHATLQRWDLASGRADLLYASKQRLDDVRIAAGDLLAFSDGTSIVILDPASSHVRCRWPGVSYDLSPDGHLVTYRDGQAIYVADTSDCRSREVYRHSAELAFGASFSPSGRQIAVFPAVDYTVLLIGIDGRVQHTLSATGSLAFARFSPDGHLLVTAGEDGILRVWDTATGTERRVLRGHAAAVNSLRFSPDGTTLASVDTQGVIRLWSAARDETEALHGHIKGVRSVVFSRDGKLLASTGFDGTLRLWPGELPHGRPSDPAGLHAWLQQATTATIEPGGQPASRAASP